jgi:hypothetical protein
VTTTATTVATTVATTAPTTTAPTTVPSSGRVNANTATIDELTQAFAAHGVSNPAQWAAEVDEYRPYDNDGWAKMFDACCLGKYSPDSQTRNAIIASLYV